MLACPTIQKRGMQAAAHAATTANDRGATTLAAFDAVEPSQIAESLGRPEPPSPLRLKSSHQKQAMVMRRRRPLLGTIRKASQGIALPKRR